MNKQVRFIFLFCFLISNLHAAASEVLTFLEGYFPDGEYKTSVYYFGGCKGLCSYLYADELNGIVSKAVFYTVHANAAILLLSFDGSAIKNSEGTIFTVIPPRNHSYFGWKLRIKGEKVYSDFYTNGGLAVTDGPSFFWDDSRQIYRKYEIDRSSW